MGVVIKLTTEYYLTTDPRNYILHRRFTGKDREGKLKEYDREIGYYGNIQQAIRRVAEELPVIARDGMITDLENWAHIIERSNQSLLEKLGPALEKYEPKA